MNPTMDHKATAFLQKQQIENTARLRALGVREGETYINFLYRIANARSI